MGNGRRVETAEIYRNGVEIEEEGKKGSGGNRRKKGEKKRASTNFL